MKLDLLYELQPRPRPWKKPHPYGQREAEQAVVREALEQTQLADKVGFNTVWCVEHHFKTTRSACSASECVLSAMAMLTKRIRIGFGVTLAPFNFTNPVRIAEKVAMVDILSGGRVEWGTGRSTPVEQTAFHVPRDHRSRDQIIEAIQIITGMWEKEYFSYHSDNYDLPERYITPRPFQDPHPPVWMASGSADSSVIAGRGGLGLLSFTLFQPVAKLKDNIDAYRAAQQEGAKPLTKVVNKRAGAYTIVHCCDDMAEAEKYGMWDSAKWWYTDIAEFMTRWEIPNSPEKEGREMARHIEGVRGGNFEIREFNDDGRIVMGTPEMCIEKLLAWENAGIDNLLCYMQFGDLPHEKVMRSIELLGTKVIPVLESRGHKVSLKTA